MQINISQVNKSDLETILSLQKKCYLAEAELYNDFTIQPLQQDLLSLENEFENSIILKYEINGAIIGSIRGYIENGIVYIGKLFVKNDFQNKGIGSELLKAIESQFNDAQRFELFTGYKSQKNLYLYKKQGYKEFKQQTISDTIVLLYLEKKK